MQLLYWCLEYQDVTILLVCKVSIGLHLENGLPSSCASLFTSLGICLAPSNLSGLLARQLRSGSRNLMVVPRALTQTYWNRLFSVVASVQWNQLPDDIRRQESTAALLKALHLVKNVILNNDFICF